MRTVPASIASSSDRAYSVVDDHPLPGQSLYRLVSIEQDGKQTISAVRSIVVPVVWKDNVLIPNPVFDGVVNVYVKANRKQMVSIRLLDMTGRVLQDEDKQLPVGQTQYQLNVSSLQKGVYVVQIVGENFKTEKRVSVE